MTRVLGAPAPGRANDGTECCMDHTYAVEQLNKRMQGKMGFPLVTNTRSFVTEALVNELFKTKTPNVKRTSTLLLFNDLLVVVTRSKWDRRYTLRSAYSLFDVQLRTAAFPGMGECQEVLRKDGDGSNLLLRFQTEDERLVPRIRQYIQQCTEVADPNAHLQCRIDASSA